VGTTDAGLTMSYVTVERTFRGDPEAVFEWFTDPEKLIRWWPSEAVTDPVNGGSYQMYWAGPDVTLRGSYNAVDPGSRLEFTWSWDHDDLPLRTVEIRFAKSGGDTVVTVVHEAGSTEEADDYESGWTHFLWQLDAEIASA